MRDYRERLRDIQEAISQIQKYSKQGKEAFFEEELIQVWIIHHLQIIGEASSTIPDNFKASYPEIPWQDMKDFRNLAVHEYFRVTWNVVWTIVEEQIPDLKQKIAQIIDETESS
ncbi:MAG: DUF86 domain-containing protein [Halothece sp.]